MQNCLLGSYHQPQKQRKNDHSPNQCLIKNLLSQVEKEGDYAYSYAYIISYTYGMNFVGVEKHSFTGGLLCSKKEMSIQIKQNIVKLSTINCEFLF